MGAHNSKKKQDELDRFVKETHFNMEEVKNLYEHFIGISSSREDDGVIDKKEFMDALGLTKNSLFIDRMFDLFDHDKNGQVDFREFITGLSVLSERGSLDEKLEFSFRIYDMDGDGCITREEIRKLLRASLVDAALDVSEAQLEQLVEATFREADINRDGKISFDEYRAMVLKHPGMLSNMTINSSNIGKK